MIVVALAPFDGADGRRLNRAYFSEKRDRFPPGYDPEAGMPTLRDDLAPPNGAFFIMRDGAQAIACAGLNTFDATTAEVKHMFVRPSHRGRGIGAQILAAVEQHARSLGMTRAVLDTNDCLTEAVALYERSGYVAIEPYNDNAWATHWFEKGLSDS